MIDAILSLVALAGFAAFLFILGWWVREPDLTIVLAIGVAMAAYDFWRTAQKHGVKPVIGVESYLTPGTSRFDRSRVKVSARKSRKVFAAAARLPSSSRRSLTTRSASWPWLKRVT